MSERKPPSFPAGPTPQLRPIPRITRMAPVPPMVSSSARPVTPPVRPPVEIAEGTPAPRKSPLATGTSDEQRALPPRRTLPLPAPRSRVAAPPRANVIPITSARRDPTGTTSGVRAIASMPPAPATGGATQASSPASSVSINALASGWSSAPGVATAAALAPQPQPQLEPPAPQAPASDPFGPMTATTVDPHGPFGAFGSPAPATGDNAAAGASPAAQPAGDPRWAVYEELGLGRPAQARPFGAGLLERVAIKQRLARLGLDSQQTAKLLVSAYRLLGFAILTIIVVVLIGYIATSAFFFMSSSWIQPMVVSPTDEKVLALEAKVAEHASARDEVAAELAHIDRYIGVQQAFQTQFAAAIKADLGSRKAALARLRELSREYAGARDQIRRSNKAYADVSRKQLAQEYAAGLIDRGELMSGKHQLAQLTSSSLSLAERQADFETRAAALEAESRGLDAILSDRGVSDALSYDVLRIKQEYEMSRLETAKAIERRRALAASLERKDAVLASLRQSPYLRASDATRNVAFVPYGNLGDVEPGAPVYGCALGMVFCGRVGKVVEVLPGEVVFKHPHREKTLRGRMVELALDDDEDAAAEDDVLFVGGRPLLI
jgi:hypothetical protein